MKLDFDKFVMSQSKLKQLEKEENCPRFWFESYVTESIPRTPNIFMAKGLYFESLCIGENAHDEEPIEPPSTLFSKGKWTAQGLRVKTQAKRFNNWFSPKSKNFQGHTITEVQKKVSGNIGGLYWEGIIDFMTKDQEGKEYIWDLKHTEDVENTKSVYGWGNYQQLDYVQQIVYGELFKQQEKKEADGVYMLVMDSSTKYGHKRIPVYGWGSETSLLEIDMRTEAFKETVEHYNINGWPEITNRWECEMCTVKDCPVRWQPNMGFKDVEGVKL